MSRDPDDRHIIFSVKPQYASEIMSGRKTVELRTRFATHAAVGRFAFIYASSPVQGMIGYARIAQVVNFQSGVSRPSIALRHVYRSAILQHILPD